MNSALCWRMIPVACCCLLMVAGELRAKDQLTSLIGMQPESQLEAQPEQPVETVYRADDSRTRVSNHQAYSQPLSSLPMSARLDFSVGNSFFRNPWVLAPSSTDARDGLGPLFNTNACQNCHIKDGRGHAPEAGDENAVSFLLRLSVPASEHDEALLREQGVVPEPRYGTQLQDFAIAGVPAEGKILVRYTETSFTFADGETVQLRQPEITVQDLAYGELSADVLFSGRIAPPMIGLGLLEAVPETLLLEAEDVDDADGDGISGKLNRVWDKAAGKTVPGRFGWKAGQPNLRQQNAAAFLGDLGITSKLFPQQQCSPVQQACQQAVSGGEPELAEHLLGQVTFYSRHLAVPERRDTEKPQVRAGEALFIEAGCEACHRATLLTGESEHPWLAYRRIAPYTDLLLHDMGEALADQRPEFLADGSEWRTPPLWGIGLTAEVSGRESYLHDGRARSLTEAILWHGGEAAAAQQAFANMSRSDRNALLMFLGSL